MLQAGIEGLHIKGRIRVTFDPLVDHLPVIGAVKVCRLVLSSSNEHLSCCIVAPDYTAHLLLIAQVLLSASTEDMLECLLPPLELRHVAVGRLHGVILLTACAASTLALSVQQGSFCTLTCHPVVSIGLDWRSCQSCESPVTGQ